MISNLVSSILNPAATAVAADKAAAHQLEDDKKQPVPLTGLGSRSISAQLDRASVLRTGSGERVDYFHSAKKMIKEAFDDFSGGVGESLTDIGVDKSMAETFAKAMVRQTKDALLWGVGFSVKVMTATVSATSNTTSDEDKPAFNIMARSIEITVNHSDGVIDVATGNVSIESQHAGGPPSDQPHLLDIKDTSHQATGSLSSALQALQDPRALLDDAHEDGGQESGVKLETIVSLERQKDIESALPRIDTPRVLSRPDYNSRILLSEINHYRNEQNDLVTFMRLDAMIPLNGKPATNAAVVPTPPTRLTVA